MLELEYSLVKRHGDHHFANVKYGYFLFFITLLQVLFIYLSRRIYLDKWIRSGRAITYRRLSTVNDIWVLTIWGLVLIALSFFHFSPHETSAFVKRLGRLAYVLVPLDIFLSLKPNPLPNVYYMELIFLHKWISRIIVIFSILHGVGFTIIWLKRGDGEIWKLFKLLNFLGVIAVIGFVISTIVSLRFMRRRFYKLFFTTHLVIAWAIVFLLQFHARPGVTFYTLVNLSLIIVQIATKVVKSRDVTIEKFTHSDSTLEVVVFENIWIRDFTAGSHLRLSLPKRNPLNYLLPSHPFTIASRPDENKIKLVVKKNSFTFKTDQKYSIFGPFASLNSNFFKTADKVVLVAGGSGVSLVLGIYEELVKNSSVSATLIWITRDENDLWILKHFNVPKIHVYLTQSKSENTELDQDDEFEENVQLLDNDRVFGDRDSFELDELDPFDDLNQVDINSVDDKLRVPSIKYGRPKFVDYANKFDSIDKANNWVVCCGATSLNKSCKAWAKSLNVRFYSESYEL